MALSRVMGAWALASLAASGAWAKDGNDTASSSPTLSSSNSSATATPVPGNLRNPPGLLSIPLKRFDSQAGGSTSVQRRYFKTNILGVYGAAYLAERE